MAEVSDKLKQFIFDHIDSVELLHVLFFLKNNSENWYGAEDVSKELRNNVDSVRNRLLHLESLGALESRLDNSYHYSPRSDDLRDLIQDLEATYKIKPHAILELIFSPTKRARQFADAFSLNKDRKPEGDK